MKRPQILSSRRLPVNLFLALCLNLLLSPAVLAASGNTISRTSAYAIAFLGIVTVALAIYLFVAMLQPQRF
jgi:K+-transporting ATPase KdpF subunit